MTKMKNALKRWAAIAPVAALAALGLVYVFGAFSGLRTFLVALIAAGLAVNCLFNLLDAQLARRIKADAPATWHVWMNDVKIGTISDADYATIQCLALHDLGNAVAQFLNVGRIAMVVAISLFLGVPVAATWSAIVWAAVNPDTLADVLRMAINADFAEMTQWVWANVPLFVLTTVVTAAGMVWMGERFGFRNHYSAAIVRMLRQHFNTPADGDIRMERINLRQGLPAPHVGFAND